MSIADRTRAEIVERLRLAESLLVVTADRAEAAERKLATAREALENIKRHLEVVAGDSLPKRGPTWLIADKALARIEQPQDVMGTVPNTKGRDWVRERFVNADDADQPTQQLPGEDPPFGMCHCSACVALRTRSEPHA